MYVCIYIYIYIYRQKDRWTDGQMDSWTAGQMDRWKVCAQGIFRVCVGANARDAVVDGKGACTTFTPNCQLQAPSSKNNQRKINE